MSNQKQRPAASSAEAKNDVLAHLKRSDLAIWKYLDELTHGNDACTASIPKIAAACKVSERQVQISIGRLINAGAIKRVGYDFSNPDRSKRGAVFKVLKHSP